MLPLVVVEVEVEVVLTGFAAVDSGGFPFDLVEIEVRVGVDRDVPSSFSYRGNMFSATEKRSIVI